MSESLFDHIPTGATISDLKPLPSDPNMRRIRVNGRPVATLRAADIEALKLEPGSRWSASLAAKVANALEIDKARKAAMKLLGHRAFSSGELIDKLVTKGHRSTVASRIADELARDHWIDDMEYARSLARETIRTKPATQRLLEHKLQLRKVDPKVAKAVATEVVQGLDPFSQAMQLAETSLKRMKSSRGQAVQRRVAALLARRGFEEDIIAEVLDRIGLNADDRNEP
jgi:regulatory protein